MKPKIVFTLYIAHEARVECYFCKIARILHPEEVLEIRKISRKIMPSHE